MQRINSLNNIHNITPNSPLRRTQSSPALMQGRDRLSHPISAIQIGDKITPFDNTRCHNFSAMVRHMNAIGIHNSHIGDILWSMMDSNSHILDEDLFNANIEHRGLEGLIRASLVAIPDNNIQSIPYHSRTSILAAHNPNDNAHIA